MELFKKEELIPCIVQSCKDGQVLMLAYMNEAAYRETLKTKELVFYSRSRKCLWRKGETSGNRILLRSLSCDCDGDTLLAIGEELGPVCHTGTRSCFQEGRIYKAEDLKNALIALFDRICERKENPKPGSYTTYLFRKGRSKICKKIGEESAEVIIAGMTETPKRLIDEMADLIYHLFVLLAERELSFVDLLEELKERLKKEGNLKKEQGF